MTGSDHALLGALMAMSVGLVKIIERLVDWMVEKKKKRLEDEERAAKGTNGHSNGHSAKLDEETAVALKEIHGIVSLKDQDGVPLVYWPRSQIATQKEIAETLCDINRSQDKMVDRLETIATNTRQK